MPKSGNATYSTSGELSTLLNDPELRTIGIGTRIFLGGAQGYVSWNGTQFNTSVPKNTSGIPKSNSATIAVIGDLKKMHTDFIKAGYFEKYGVSIFIGIGIPISLLDEEMAVFVSVKNEQESINKEDLDRLRNLYKLFVIDILGLREEPPDNLMEITSGLINIVQSTRKKAKQNKDYETSDRIRNTLNEIGVEIKDTKDGFEWEIKKLSEFE